MFDFGFEDRIIKASNQKNKFEIEHPKFEIKKICHVLKKVDTFIACYLSCWNVGNSIEFSIFQQLFLFCFFFLFSNVF